MNMPTSLYFLMFRYGGNIEGFTGYSAEPCAPTTKIKEERQGNDDQWREDICTWQVEVPKNCQQMLAMVQALAEMFGEINMFLEYAFMLSWETDVEQLNEEFAYAIVSNGGELKVNVQKAPLVEEQGQVRGGPLYFPDNAGRAFKAFSRHPLIRMDLFILLPEIIREGYKAWLRHGPKE